jgi:hypothetical protein
MTLNSGTYVSISKNGNIILVMCISYKIWDDLSIKGKEKKRYNTCGAAGD